MTRPTFRGRIWSGPDDGLELSCYRDHMVRAEPVVPERDTKADHPTYRDPFRNRSFVEVRYLFRQLRPAPREDGVALGIWIPEDIADRLAKAFRHDKGDQ